MFWRALLGRCPICGQRGIFARWGELVDRCPHCAYSFQREEGYWVGAMIVNMAAVIAVFLVIFLGGLALFWPAVPWTPLTYVAGAAVLFVGVWFYPRSKTLWVWLDLLVHPYSDEERP